MKTPRNNTGYRHHAERKGKDPRPSLFDLQKKAWDAEQGIADEDLESAIDEAMYFGLGE